MGPTSYRQPHNVAKMTGLTVNELPVPESAIMTTELAKSKPVLESRPSEYGFTALHPVTSTMEAQPFDHEVDIAAPAQPAQQATIAENQIAPDVSLSSMPESKQVDAVPATIAQD